MHDQAIALRQLVSSATTEGLATPAPPLIVVAGGKGGVGATTIAVNLAVALAQQGQRTVLVDANLNQPDAAALCRLEEKETILDVLAGRRTVHEVLQRGPAGLQVLPGHWAPERTAECSPAAGQRLLAALGRLGAHADAIVLDAGSGMSPIAQRFVVAADLLLLVTTPEGLSVMNTYAAMKVLASRLASVSVRTVVNQITDHEVSEEIHARIRQACQRFLGLETEAAASIPADTEVAEANRTGKPLVLGAPTSAAAQQIRRLADQVVQMVHGAGRQPMAAAG